MGINLTVPSATVLYPSLVLVLLAITGMCQVKKPIFSFNGVHSTNHDYDYSIWVGKLFVDAARSTLIVCEQVARDLHGHQQKLHPL